MSVPYIVLGTVFPPKIKIIFLERICQAALNQERKNKYLRLPTIAAAAQTFLF